LRYLLAYQDPPGAETKEAAAHPAANK
jgi:hypothetical protein